MPVHFNVHKPELWGNICFVPWLLKKVLAQTVKKTMITSNMASFFNNSFIDYMVLNKHELFIDFYRLLYAKQCTHFSLNLFTFIIDNWTSEIKTSLH